jgi:hypothetical protein
MDLKKFLQFFLELKKQKEKHERALIEVNGNLRN